MTRIVFVDDDGVESAVEAENGVSVMETAMANDIDGILAECGGACACATCHVYVDEKFLDIVGKPDELEQSMLDFNDNTQSNSRLSCQIEVGDELEGLRVTTPASQY